MKIAVLEFVCGGGVKGSNSVGCTPPDLASYRHLYREGFAMLGSLASDISKCGHDVVTCLDTNAKDAGAQQELTTHRVACNVIHSSNAWLEDWIETAEQCDTTIIIAPELDNILFQTVAALRNHGLHVLSSSLPFLQATTDKWMSSKLLAAHNVHQPQTWMLSEYLSIHLQHPSTPMTLKRRDGAGCVGMRFFENANDLNRYVKNESNGCQANLDQWLVQPWHGGQPASIALVAHPGSAKFLGSLEQSIHIEPLNDQRVYNVSYRGGAGPIRSIDFERLEQTAEAVLEALPRGALGWIGIDLLLPSAQDPEITVIEINPRLTTSYLGYRKWYGPALANLLLGISVDPPTPSMPNIVFEV